MNDSDDASALEIPLNVSSVEVDTSLSVNFKLGDIVGCKVGIGDGLIVGEGVGAILGLAVGILVVVGLKLREGLAVGCVGLLNVGFAVTAIKTGLRVGWPEGWLVGWSVGKGVNVMAAGTMSFFILYPETTKDPPLVPVLVVVLLPVLPNRLLELCKDNRESLALASL